VSESVRTFIAIELPSEVRPYLADCQSRLKRAGGDVRWVRPELIHLTLVFLGDVPADMLGDVETAVRSAVAGFGPLTLRLGGAGCFPPRGAPRVIWLGVEEPTGRLAALQKSLAQAPAAFAEKAEDRAYAAHLTLGRVRSPRGARDLSAAVGAMGGQTGPTFAAAEVTLFRSDLSPQRPTYTALARVALDAK
jgi:2'-5' RNA ligase